MRTKHNDIKCLQYIPLLKCDQINIDELHEFLKKIMVDYPHILANGNSNEKSNLRRIIKIFDWLKYNQKSKEPQPKRGRITRLNWNSFMTETQSAIINLQGANHLR